MNERFIYLTENYFDENLSPAELKEFEEMLAENETLASEFQEQKNIKEVMAKMKMKNPSAEVWDGYWMGIYNRVERGLAWVAVSIGALIFLGFMSYEIVNAFINDTETPGLVKFGIAAMTFGFLVLLFSVVREKYFTHKKDRYKEIQR